MSEQDSAEGTATIVFQDSAEGTATIVFQDSAEGTATIVFRQVLLLIAVTLFAAGPLIVHFTRVAEGKTAAPAPSADQLIFFGLATLPGLIGLVNYISSQRTRYELQKDALRQLQHDSSNPEMTDPSKFEPTLVSWLTGSLLLTGVFMIVAVLARFADRGTLQIDGIVYAGYGAYVATLWFMLGRLNAHALSPRFLVNSAIKAAIAILIGFIASTSLDFFKPAPAGGAAGTVTSTHMLLFMVGFFHDWALGYIRKKAVEVFQANQNAATELPVGMIEGVDDAAADLLDEMGISSVQHLATQNPLELSMRSLYPIKRVIDWVDQALLTLYFHEKIVAARELGIRGVAEFVAIYMHASGLLEGSQKEAQELMTALAQKLGMSEAALYLMADACRHDDAVKFVYNLRHFGESKGLTTAPPPPPPGGGDGTGLVKPSADTETPLTPEAAAIAVKKKAETETASADPNKDEKDRENGAEEADDA
jgi:hypothetical protein